VQFGHISSCVNNVLDCSKHNVHLGAEKETSSNFNIFAGTHSSTEASNYKTSVLTKSDFEQWWIHGSQMVWLIMSDSDSFLCQ